MTSGPEEQDGSCADNTTELLEAESAILELNSREIRYTRMREHCGGKAIPAKNRKYRKKCCKRIKIGGNESWRSI